MKPQPESSIQEVLAGLVELGDAVSLADFGGPFEDLSASAAFLYESLR